MQIRDRIKELRRVPARELLPNEKNWRAHSTQQSDALRAVMAEVGWADAVLAYPTPDGLKLIDGHLRAEIAPDAEVPVLILDITDAEAGLIHATHDPLASMATVGNHTSDIRETPGAEESTQASGEPIHLGHRPHPADLRHRSPC